MSVNFLPFVVPILPAHVRWFLAPGVFPVRVETVASMSTLVEVTIVLAAVAAGLLARHLARARGLTARAQVKLAVALARYGVSVPRPSDLYRYLPALLAVHVAILLMSRGVSRQLFVPNLPLPYNVPGGTLALGEIVVALFLLGGLLIGGLTRIAALGIAALVAGGSVLFGPLLVIEHIYFLGVAAFLFITGPGPRLGNRLIVGLDDPISALLPHAVRILTATFGFATLLTGFTEKLVNHDLAMAFLSEHPFNFTRSTPLPLSDVSFINAAGMAESILGAVLLAGVAPRLAILATWVPFNLAVPFLGAADALGHLPIYAILLVVLVAGDGNDLGSAWATRNKRARLGPRTAGAMAPAPPVPAVLR